MTRRFLALGDSYTIGEGVEASDRWPVLLAGRLREAGLDLADPVISATTGWTTDELAAGIREAAPRGEYELVSLLIGVNNQYRGRPLDEYRQQFQEILGTAIAFAGGDVARVLVLSIPDWGVTPFANGRDRAQIAREIDAFNEVNREESKSARVRYVDITRTSRTWSNEVAGDGLHPSARQYARWAELTLPSALSALQD